MRCLGGLFIVGSILTNALLLVLKEYFYSARLTALSGLHTYNVGVMSSKNSMSTVIVTSMVTPALNVDESAQIPIT